MVGGGGVVNLVNNLCQARHVDERKHVQHDVCIIVLLSGLHIRAGFSSMILRSQPLTPNPPPLAYAYIYIYIYIYMLQAIREVRHFMKCLKMSGIS